MKRILAEFKKYFSVFFLSAISFRTSRVSRHKALIKKLLSETLAHSTSFKTLKSLKQIQEVVWWSSTELQNYRTGLRFESEVQRKQLHKRVVKNRKTDQSDPDVCPALIYIQSGTRKIKNRPAHVWQTAGLLGNVVYLLQVEHQTLQHGIERLPSPLTPRSWEEQSIMGHYTSHVQERDHLYQTDFILTLCLWPFLTAKAFFTLCYQPHHL